MTIFRHKNGKLYTLEMVKRPRYTEAPQLVATPYLHKEIVKRPKRADFTAIAEK
jgi:hypothetical protein